jgi:thiol-disulfide isomerase/thioredoxin
MGPIAERGVHAVTILFVLVLAVAALKHWQKRKARRARPLLVLETGKVSIVYFHSPSCGVCRASQKPILERLLARVGTDKVRLVTVDVSEAADVAREWGVTTLPSTYVIDPAGDVAHVNNGLASEPTLRRQVSC